MPQSGVLGDHVILFDLGGVLMDFGGTARLAALTGRANDEALRSQWASSKWLRAYERGQCDADTFGAGTVADFGLELTGSEFVAEFATWPAGPFAGSVDLVRRLYGRIPMGCLSNTNPTHWQQHLDRWGIVDYFDWTLVSHELGTMKPDPEIYRSTLKLVGVPPERILFLDDRLENVTAARTHGLRAEHTCGIDDVKRAIGAHFPTLM